MPGVDRQTVMKWLEDHINALPEPKRAAAIMATASYELGVPMRSLKEYIEILHNVGRIGMTDPYYVWAIRDVWPIGMNND